MLSVILAIVSAGLCVAVFTVWRGKSTLEERLRDDVAARAAAEATVTQLQAALEEKEACLTETRSAHDAMRATLTTAERNEALARQKLEGMELRLSEFELLKKQFEEYAKSAALAAGNEISNKLLADNQREREAAQKQQQSERETVYKQFEQFSKTANEQFLQRQQELASALANVQGQVHESSKHLGVLVRAMQNPMGAGAEGEIVLNNILQQHGFSAGVDYDLQVHLAGEESTLRPDGVIYLPHNHAVILDAKASHHIYALFTSEDGSAEFDANFSKLRDTMKTHARALASKAYRDGVKKLKAKNGEPFSRTTLIMFVPNDEVVTRLYQRDAELGDMLRQNEIILLGPATLSSFLLVAASLVREARQADAQQAILDMAAALMGDVVMAMKHAEKIIGGIQNSAKAFDQFSASMNRALSRMRKMRDKGLAPPKNVALPSNLPRYDIAKSDELIQGEAEEVAELLQLPKDAA